MEVWRMPFSHIRTKNLMNFSDDTSQILKQIEWNSEFSEIDCNFLQDFGGPQFLHSLYKDFFFKLSKYLFSHLNFSSSVYVH